MRKYLVILVCLLFVGTEAGAKVGFAPEIGLNISQLSVSGVTFPRAGDVGSFFDAGLKLGLNFDFKRNDNFSWQVGVFYSQCGARLDANVIFVGNVMTPVYISYAQLPICAVYRTKLRVGDLVFAGGAYVGYAFASSANPADSSLHTDYFKLGLGSDAFIKNIDFGLRASVAYQLQKGFFVKLSEDFGLANIAAQSGQSMYNRATCVSIGWFYRSTKQRILNKAY